MRLADGPVRRRNETGEQSYLIQQCDSPLAMRQALRQPIDEGATKILVTPLEETDLANDILLRLAKRRLFQIDSWQIVRSFFQARAVDPRLTRSGWIADLLLERVPTDGYPAARGGFLDAETVWPLLLRQGWACRQSLPTSRHFSSGRWMPRRPAVFGPHPRRSANGVTEWLVEKVGPVAAVVLRCAERTGSPDAVPLGLAAGVVFHPEAPRAGWNGPAGKIEERYLGGKTPEAEPAAALEHGGHGGRPCSAPHRLASLSTGHSARR